MRHVCICWKNLMTLSQLPEDIWRCKTTCSITNMRYGSCCQFTRNSRTTIKIISSSSSSYLSDSQHVLCRQNMQIRDSQPVLILRRRCTVSALFRHIGWFNYDRQLTSEQHRWYHIHLVIFILEKANMGILLNVLHSTLNICWGVLFHRQTLYCDDRSELTESEPFPYIYHTKYSTLFWSLHQSCKNGSEHSP